MPITIPTTANNKNSNNYMPVLIGRTLRWIPRDILKKNKNATNNNNVDLVVVVAVVVVVVVH